MLIGWIGTYAGQATMRRALEALAGFERFPTWMWRNADVLDFVGWLRAHNERRRPGARPVGFYGLDLYSLGASMEAVIAYLDEQDPEAATRARARYECLQPYTGESAAYGQAVLLGAVSYTHLRAHETRHDLVCRL